MAGVSNQQWNYTRRKPPTPDEGRDFVSMLMEIDDFIVGDSEAISVLGLMVGEARKIIDSMLKIKQNAHGSLGVDCIEGLNAFLITHLSLFLGR